MNHRILIVDARNAAYRARFAFPDLTTQAGESTSVTFGTIQIIHSILAESKFDKCIVIWDTGKAAFRKELLPVYKVRTKVFTDVLDIEDFEKQIETVHEMLKNLGVCSIKLDQKIEADDAIAYLVTQVYSKDDVVIVTTDKDFFQLINEQVQVFRPMQNKEILLGLSNFEEYTGFPSPAHYLVAVCLSGDTSDCIKGVGQIGEVTAKKIALAANGQFAEARQILPEEKAEIFDRNMKLMDLNYGVVQLDGPTTAALKAAVEELPLLNEVAVKEKCRALGFASILTGFLRWIFPFRQLVISRLVGLAEPKGEVKQ